MNKDKDYHNRDWLQLSEKFTGEAIYLSDSSLFSKPITIEQAETKLPSFANKSLEKEARAFLQDIIVMRHFTAESSKQYINHLCSLELLVNTDKYRNLSSFTELSEDEFKSNLEDVLKAHGYLAGESKRRTANCCRFYKWLYEQYNPKDYNNWFDEDVWVLEKLPFKVNAGALFRATISFESIKTDWIKEPLKQVAKREFLTKSVGTVRDTILAVTILDDYVVSSGFKKGQRFTRNDAENVLRLLNERYNPSSFNHVLGRIEKFLDYAHALGFNYLPTSERFMKSDRHKKPAPDPKPYSTREMNRMIEHLDKLDGMDYEITVVLMEQGLRVSDICEIKMYDYNGELTLKNKAESKSLAVWNYKTRQRKPVALRKMSAEIISNRVKQSLETYGTECQYIFATAVDNCIRTETYRRHLRKWIKDNDIRGDDGNLIRIGNTHRFRSTTITNVIRKTNNPEAAASLVGQSDLSSLAHYSKLAKADVLESMIAYRDDNNTAVRQIGKKTNVFEEQMPKGDPSKENIIPMSNGYCRKPGSEICRHANACYKCVMFEPTRKHLEIYKIQLMEATMAKQRADMMGYTTISEHNKEVIEYLSKVIVRLEGETL